MIIEWNAHMFSSDTETYPHHPDAAYKPDPSRSPDDPLSVYLDRMSQEGIDRAILVHPEPYGDDHRLILDCLKREPDRFLGTSLYYPKDPDGPRKLADLVAEEPKVIATRFHAHRGKEQYLDSFSSAGVVSLWEKAAELGLVIELHIGPNYAGQCGPLIRSHPETPVLIDHLAEPHKGSAVEFADVLELATFDNTYMKLSGLNHFSKNAPLYEEARPFTKRVIEEFGPDRMVWGSGTPGIVDAHMREYEEQEREKVKGMNVQQMLEWQ